MIIIIHSDGGSLGNPGPSAIGVVVEMNGKRKTYAQDIGHGTNNEAEYQALIFGLKKVKALAGGRKAKQTNVQCRLDSQLVVSQLNHEYQLKNPNIINLFVKVWNLMLDFQSVTFTHVPREQNQEADRLVKSVLNRHNQRKMFQW